MITKAQQQALKKVYDRDPQGRTYLQFRRTARVDHLMNCVMVPFAGMWLGIEEDGYTHS